MSTPFDSHKYAKRLMEAGMQPALAEIQAETTGELFNELGRCNAKIEQTELKLELKISESRTELIRWVVGIAILQSSLLTGFMLRLIH